MVGNETKNKLEGISKEALAIFTVDLNNDPHYPPQNTEQVINAFKDTYRHIIENPSFKPGEIATGKQLKKVFRKLSNLYHPDINKDPNAKEIYLRINKAYAILSDPDKKRIIDNALEAYWSRSTIPRASAVDAMGEPVGKPEPQQQVVYTLEQIQGAKNYISRGFALNLTPTQIREELLKGNWKPDMVDDWLVEAQSARNLDDLLGTGDNKEGTDESNTNLTAPEKYVTSRKNDGKSEVDAQNELDVLSGYIEGRFVAGISADKIKKDLTDKNWNAELVDYYVSLYTKMLQDAPKPAPKEEPKPAPKKVVKKIHRPKKPKEEPKPKEAPKPVANEGTIDDLVNDVKAVKDEGTLVYDKDYSMAYHDFWVRDIDSTNQYNLQQVLTQLHTAKFDKDKEGEKKARALLKKYHSALHAYEKELQRKFTEKGVSLVESKSRIFEKLKALQQGKQAFEKGEEISKEKPVRDINRYSKAQYAGHVTVGVLTAAGMYLADKFNVIGNYLPLQFTNVHNVALALDGIVSNLSTAPFGFIPGLPNVPIVPEIIIGLGFGAAVAYGNVKEQAKVVADTAKRYWHKMFKESAEPPEESEDSEPAPRQRMRPPPPEDTYDNGTGNQSNLESKLPPQGPPANDSGFVDVPEDDDLSWVDNSAPPRLQPAVRPYIKVPLTVDNKSYDLAVIVTADGRLLGKSGRQITDKTPIDLGSGKTTKLDIQSVIDYYNSEISKQ
jgi:hypothetical protein